MPANLRSIFSVPYCIDFDAGAIGKAAPVCVRIRSNPFRERYFRTSVGYPFSLKARYPSTLIRAGSNGATQGLGT